MSYASDNKDVVDAWTMNSDTCSPVMNTFCSDENLYIDLRMVFQ